MLEQSPTKGMWKEAAQTGLPANARTVLTPSERRKVDFPAIGKTAEADKRIGPSDQPDPLHDPVLILLFPVFQQPEHDEVKQEQAVEDGSQQHIKALIKQVQKA